MKFQKLMWHNMIRSTKSKKVSILHYNIDIDYCFLPGQRDSREFSNYLALSRIYLFILLAEMIGIYTRESLIERVGNGRF